MLNDARLIKGVACRLECQTISNPVRRLAASKGTIVSQGIGCSPANSSPYISVEQAIADANQSKRHIEEKDPAPGCVGRNESADWGAKHWRHQAGPRDKRSCPQQMLFFRAAQD